jgi:hypothetical protein
MRTTLSAIAAMVTRGLFACPLQNGDWMVGKGNMIYRGIDVGSDHYTDPELSVAPSLPEAVDKWLEAHP